MKWISLNKVWILAIIVATALTSCQKTLDINTDPNKAPTATVDLVLPAAQVEMALPFATWNFVGSMWGQYWTGGHGVSSSNLENYVMQSVDVENAWTRAYARCLADIGFLTKSGQPIYSGMGKIMSAYLIQMLTDLHGDVPYTEAAKGAIEDGGILIPKFDSPQDIYAGLQTQLDEAIDEVQQTGASVQEPADDDLMYGGNIDQWIALANTLKLKLYVRSGNTTAAKALMDAGTTFIDDGDDAAIFFNETTKNTNPIWARFNARVDVGMYYVATSSSIDKLVALDDPRIDAFYTKPTLPGPGSAHLGVDAGNINTDPKYLLTPPTNGAASERRKNFSNVNSGVFSATTPNFFVTSWESKFLQAEVLIRSGADASAMFAAAVQSSFDYLGVAGGPAYITSLGFGGTQDEQLDILGVQKWISMNGLQMTEGWLESIRFERPGHPIFSGGIYTSPDNNSLGAFKYPTSFVYPTQEVSLNPNTPAGRKVTDQRFWDN